jgi:hypothetical protein
VRCLGVIPLGTTAVSDRAISRLEVHSIRGVHPSRIKGEILFESNRFTTMAVFTGSAAPQAAIDPRAQDLRRQVLDLATAVLKKIAHDLELGQLAGLSAPQPPSTLPTPKPRMWSKSNGGNR